MKIGELQQKKLWYRDVLGEGNYACAGSTYANRRGIPLKSGIVRISVTQDDFKTEINPFTHNINSTSVRSDRQVFKMVTDKKGTKKRVFSHWAEVSRVSTALQNFIISNKVAHFAGGGIWMSNEVIGSDKEFSALKSEYDTAGIHYAWRQVIKSLFYTCDAAIYQYVENKEVKWQVFSALKGDTLYPSIDREGNAVFARKFTYQGKDAMQIFTKGWVELWTQDDKEEKKNEEWYNRWFKGFFDKDKTGRKSEDGWSQVYRKKNQLPDRLAVTYLRIEELPSAIVQLAIESIEDVLSDFSEEAKMYAYQIMFIKGKVKTLPSPTTRGKVLAATGENDDAKILSPADSSDIVKILMEKLESSVFRDSNSVYLTPDMIKGSDVATASLRLLFAPQIQWCEDMQAHVFLELKEMMGIFKMLVGKATGKVSAFEKLKISVGMDVWIPENEKEAIEITTMKVYAGLMSRKAGISEIDNKHPDEEAQMTKEAKEKAELSNIGKEDKAIGEEVIKKAVEPKVDNKATS